MMPGKARRLRLLAHTRKLRRLADDVDVAAMALAAAVRNDALTTERWIAEDSPIPVTDAEKHAARQVRHDAAAALGAALGHLRNAITETAKL